MLGYVRVQQGKKRLEKLTEIFTLLVEYSNDLKQYRRSINECLNGRGPIAEKLLVGEFPKGLTSEDRDILTTLLQQLKVSSYKHSIAATDEGLKKLQITITKLKEEDASQWKALPLVTGAIAFLIAVLLF